MHIQPSQFEFIGFEFEPAEGGLTDRIINAAIEDFQRAKSILKGGEGLTDKELDLIVQNMCLGVTTKDGTNLWDKATPEQRKEINRLSRALKRIEAKNDKNTLVQNY